MNTTENKKSKFKNIFRAQIDTTMNNHLRKPVNRIEISPPVLQHSTSIFVLVSPIKSNGTFFDKLYQPQSSPPPIPKQKKYNTPNSTISSTSKRIYENIRSSISSTSSPIENNLERRHSISSSTIYIKDSEKIIMEENEKEESSNNQVKHMNSLRKLTERRRSSNNKVHAIITSTISTTLSRSKSTPIKKDRLKKSLDDREKVRKMKEFEDLITAKCESTLKLSLTPKGLK